MPSEKSRWGSPPLLVKKRKKSCPLPTAGLAGEYRSETKAAGKRKGRFPGTSGERAVNQEPPHVSISVWQQKIRIPVTALVPASARDLGGTRPAQRLRPGQPGPCPRGTLPKPRTKPDPDSAGLHPIVATVRPSFPQG